MKCTVQNMMQREEDLILFSGGSVSAMLTLPAGGTTTVEFRPQDMLAYTGRRLKLQASHDGQTVKWPTDFTH